MTSVLSSLRMMLTKYQKELMLSPALSSLLDEIKVCLSWTLIKTLAILTSPGSSHVLKR
jgi:hypothetical protein